MSQRTEPLLMHVAIRGTAALEFGVLMSSIIQVCASARGEVYVHSKVTDPMHTHQFWEMLLACFPQSIASVPLLVGRSVDPLVVIINFFLIILSRSSNAALIMSSFFD